MPAEQMARWIFRLAGVYGLLVITPMLFLEEKLGRDFPPAMNHPENFYGFVSVGLAWQVLFLCLARDPIRYRLMMLPAFLEKALYGAAMVALFLQQRLPMPLLGFVAIDLILGALFVYAFWRTRDAGN